MPTTRHEVQRGKKEFFSVLRAKQTAEPTACGLGSLAVWAVSAVWARQFVGSAVIWPAVNILCNAIGTQCKTKGLACFLTRIELLWTLCTGTVMVESSGIFIQTSYVAIFYLEVA